MGRQVPALATDEIRVEYSIPQLSAFPAKGKLALVGQTKLSSRSSEAKNVLSHKVSGRTRNKRLDANESVEEEIKRRER